ncbi:MAG TPA: zf-HC2 domain-containing protein [Gemmatimonadales bacterium]|nr:zf-HC2 domain-containing protein [Gemmatimonadales bacterium]
MPHPDEGMFHALLDGELTPDEVRIVEAHVASCAACAARLEDVRAVFDESTALVERLELPERKASGSSVPPLDLVRATRARTIPSQRLRTLAWAATVVIAAGAGYLAGDWRHRVPGQTPATAMNERGQVPAVSTERVSGDRAAEPPGDEVGQRVARSDLPSVGAARPLEREQAPVNAGVGGAAEAQAARGNVSGKPELESPTARRDRLAQVARTEERDVGRAADAPAVQAPGADAAPSRAAVSGLVEDARREGAFAKAAEAAPAEGFRAQVTPPRSVTLEDAVDALNGAIRLVDGASLTRVETSDPPAVPWAEVEGPLVRVVYRLEGAEVVLSQVRISPGREAVAERAAAKRALDAIEDVGTVPHLAPGDTLVVAEPGGGYRVWWLDGSRRILSLSGPLGQDALKLIVARVR